MSYFHILIKVSKRKVTRQLNVIHYRPYSELVTLNIPNNTPSTPTTANLAACISEVARIFLFRALGTGEFKLCLDSSLFIRHLSLHKPDVKKMN